MCLYIHVNGLLAYETISSYENIYSLVFFLVSNTVLLSICWLIDISSMKGLPTFDSSSDGHESGIAVPSAGASNLASHEGFGDPGLPGEWGHAEPR